MTIELTDDEREQGCHALSCRSHFHDAAVERIVAARVDAAVKSANLAAAERVIANVWALHERNHACQGGDYTIDSTYRGTRLHKGPCPTLALLPAAPTDETGLTS